MALVIVAGFILPCFILSAILQDKVCWFFIALVILILIGLSYLLFDCMTTVFFRKANHHSSVSSKEVIISEDTGNKEKIDLT
jgi:hypothetical protein